MVRRGGRVAPKRVPAGPLAALKKHADKEKDTAIANHSYRALSRCGPQDAKVRALLLKEAGSGKGKFASYGPCIGPRCLTSGHAGPVPAG